MKKIIIIALLSLSGVAQAACEKEQQIVDDPKGLSPSSHVAWIKQLASCLMESKERVIEAEKYAAEAKIKAEEYAEKQRIREAKFNSFKEPVPGSETFFRDIYARELGRNKLIEEEFGHQCLGKFSKEPNEYCLSGKSNLYTRSFMLQSSKDMADEEPALQASIKKVKAETNRRARLPGVRIGDSTDHVTKNTSWGRPDSVNRTTTSAGTREQWVYGSRNYLYFTNGVLTAIQN